MSKPRPTSFYLIQFGFYSLVVLFFFGMVFSFSYLFGALFSSVVLALMLEPLVNYLEMKGLARVPAILVIYLCIAASIAILISFLVPLIVNEIKILVVNFPEYSEQLHDQVKKIESLIKHRFPNLTLPDYYSFATEKLFSYFQLMVGSVPQMASGLISVISTAVLIPLITFFLLADGHLISKAILSIVPNRYFEMCVLLLHKIVMSCKLFVRGQLLDSCSIMITTTIGYAIIGLPYCIVIGVISGLANFIPYFGSLISVVAALFVLLVTPGAFSIWALLGIAIVFICVQIIDGTLVYPNVVGRQVNLHPLAVIIGVAAGGSMAGILGMLVVIPVISICKVTLEVLHTYLKSYSIL